MSESPKYSITVYENNVEIEGKLTIREAFDFLSFFDQMGFTTLERNCDGETLTLSKIDLETEERKRIIQESIENNKFYEKLYEEAKDEISRYKIRSTMTDGLIENLMETTEENEQEIANLRNEVFKLKSQLKLENALEQGVLNEPTENIEE